MGWGDPPHEGYRVQLLKDGSETSEDAATMSWELPGLARSQQGYPPEWPLVAWMVKAAGGWRCEHCGAHFTPGGAGDEALTVHHLDGNRDNLQTWNLVALCLRDHALVERVVVLDAPEQLTLTGEPLVPWLAARLRDREHYPWRPARSSEQLSQHGERPGAQVSGERLCACGCGQPVPRSRANPRRYLNRAHQQLAYRERRAEQRSLLTLLAEHEGG